MSQLQVKQAFFCWQSLSPDGQAWWRRGSTQGSILRPALLLASPSGGTQKDLQSSQVLTKGPTLGHTSMREDIPINTHSASLPTSYMTVRASAKWRCWVIQKIRPLDHPPPWSPLGGHHSADPTTPHKGVPGAILGRQCTGECDSENSVKLEFPTNCQ